MCDDIVPASPGNKRRRRRCRWTKSPKKLKSHNESSCLEISAFTNRTASDLPTSVERSASDTAGCEQSIAPFDISQIYGAQVIEDEADVGPVDIFAYANLLEKAALRRPERRPSSTAKQTATQTFTAACDLIELQKGSSQLNASSVSDTQVLRLCEAADIIEEIKKSNIELSSQWECSWRRTQPGPSAISMMDTIDINTQDSMAQDILRDCISQDIVPPSPRRELRSRDEQKFSRAPQTYSRLRAKQQKDRQIAQRLADHFDSDSNSSLSKQNDDLLEVTPADCGDLHRSFRVCENFENLSSFFSQSFNQEEHDATVDGVYKRIMGLKAKRWESRLCDWYISGTNFRLSENDSCGSSAPFEGFRSDELNSLQSESTCESKDISRFLLDDDEDLFHAVRATCLVSNMNEGVSSSTRRERTMEEVANNLEGALKETNRSNRSIRSARDSYFDGTTLNNPEEEIVARIPCGNLNRESSLNITPDTEESHKYANTLPKSTPTSQIWLDENLFSEFTTPTVSTSAQNSVKELINPTGCIVPKTDENENSTNFDKGILKTVRRNSFKVPVCEPSSISSVLKESRYKPGESSVETQIGDNFLNGASQWNANTSFPGCEVEFTETKLGGEQNSLSTFDEGKGFTGSESGSGKPILEPKEIKARTSKFVAKVDASIKDGASQDSLKSCEEISEFTGFKSATRKSSLASKGMADRARNHFVKLDTFKQDKVDKDSLKSFGESKGFSGFKSVSGKPIPVSKEAANRASKVFSEVDTWDKADQASLKCLEQTKGFTGFKSVSGNTVLVSKSENKASNLFDEVNAFVGNRVNQDPLKCFGASDGFTGFSTVSGKPVLISKEATNRASNLIAEVDAFIQDGEEFHNKPTVSKSNSQGAITGFRTVSGKVFELSDAGQCIANKFLTELNNWTENDFLTDVEGQPASTTEKLTKPLIDVISSEAKQMYNRFNDKENIIRPPPTGVPRIQSLNPNSSVKTCKRPISSCFENTSGTSAFIPTFLGDDNPTKRLKSSNPPATITSRNQATSSDTPQSICDAPLIPLTRNEFVTPVKSKSVLHEFNTPDLQKFFAAVETSTPQTIKRDKNFSLSQEISASIAALAADELKSSTVTDDFHTIKWDDFEDSFHDKSEAKGVIKAEDKSDANILPEKVPEIVTQIRDDLRQKLDRLIEEKEHFPRQMSSTALCRKNTDKIRRKLTDLVENRKPKVLTVNELINKGLRAEVAQMRFTLAQDFKFSEPLKGRTFVMAESTYIIPDEYNKIGLHEIKRAFLTIPSVYTTLLPEGWVDHHYKMIVLKLAMLEKSFPESFTNQLCTPENMIMQLSYRYYREIDRAERSCLKRILENDDSPGKRIVLLVLDVHENNGQVELELSDWWYSVRASVDMAMVDLLRCGKVHIGTKLMVQGAKLLNCDNGCSPLEMSSYVRLKIHTNSCRRAVWDLKLGFFKNPKPFYIALDSVKENGGLIFKLKLHVLRVYPTVYLTRTGDSQGIHSQKVEDRLRKDEERIDFDNFELICSQVQHELQQERMTKRKKVKCSSTVTDPEELYMLIDEGYDLEDTEVDLSPDELNKVIKYQQDALLRSMDEVNHRVKEKLSEQVPKRSSTELVRIRVIDLKYPKSSAILSIWRPSENHHEMLKEGISIEVTNCTPSGVRYGDMQLNSTKNSEFNFISEKLITSGIQHMLRRVVTIKEINSSDFVPVFNELDTLGFVVMITNAEQRKFESVFLCDAEENILCINFWKGLKQYAYDDVIQNGRFISASNLQTRVNSKTGIVPCLFATEISVFTERPKTDDMRNALTALKSSLIDSDLSILSSKCVEQIESLKKNNVSGNSLVTPTRKSLSCTKPSFHNTLKKNSPAINTSAIPSAQNRIDRLKMYGEPPDLPPVVLKMNPVLRSSFKLPHKFGEDSQDESR